MKGGKDPIKTQNLIEKSVKIGFGITVNSYSSE